MNTFTMGGVTYIAKKFDFNLVCDLEDLGVSIQDAAKKPMAMVRAYISLCINGTVEEAGKIMEEHVISGGSFEDIMSVMSKEMESSDFFRNINKPTVAKKTSKAQTKA